MNYQGKKILQLAQSPVQAELSDPGRSGRGMRFRESRLKIPDTIKCRLKWRDFYGQEVYAQVRDLSRYGCRVLLSQDSVPKLYNRILKAEIEIDSLIAYQGSIIFVHEKQERDGVISAGVTLEQTGCDLDSLAAAIGVKSTGIENDLMRVQSLSESVRGDFKILVADLNALLQEACQKLQIEETKIERMATSDNHRFRLEERVISVAISIYGPKLQATLSDFQKLVCEMDVDEEAEHKKYFRLNFQSLVKGTPFVERGLKKPLGYSGDYGMMVMLYEYVDQGTTLFNRFFHRFVCSEPAAIANKNRVGFLSDILVTNYEKALKTGDNVFTIVSIACGPAREIYEFLKFAPLSAKTPVKIILIDSEEHALDYAQARLREISVPARSVDLVFLKEDAVTGVLQNKEFLKWFRDANCIISAGLFDYLTERVSRRLINSLVSYLRPCGQLLIGNISKRNPDVFAMDYFMDWRLILRDEPDLLKLVNPELKMNYTADVISESLGLNLFLRVVRNSTE